MFIGLFIYSRVCAVVRVVGYVCGCLSKCECVCVYLIDCLFVCLGVRVGVC